MIFGINFGSIFGLNWHTQLVTIWACFILLLVLFACFVMYISDCTVPRYVHLRGVISTFVEEEVQGGDKAMITVSKQDILEGSPEILGCDLLRDDLERLFCQDSHIAALKEQCNEIVAIATSLSSSMPPEKAAGLCHSLSKKLKDVVKNYASSLPPDVAEKMNSHAYAFSLWGDVCSAFSDIKGDLTENSSPKVLKSWSNWLELLSEAVEIYPECISPRTIVFWRKAMQVIMSVTSARDVVQRQNHHYKRSLRNSASFILEQISRIHGQSPWDLVIGKNSYNQLLRESQSRIDLLDYLVSETEEEEKEQEELLDYLHEALKRHHD